MIIYCLTNVQSNLRSNYENEIQRRKMFCCNRVLQNVHINLSEFINIIIDISGLS